MRDRQPWSVRGVAREARVKAARAAQHRHMTIGEWLTRVVLDAADHDLGRPGGEHDSGRLPATREQTGDLAGALGALVDHLEKSGGDTGDLAHRIERTEAVLAGRMEQIAAAMYAVMQTVEKHGMRPVEPDNRQQAIAEGQARIAEQIASMAFNEQRHREQMEIIARALATLAAGTASDHRDEPDETAPSGPDRDKPGTGEDAAKKGRTADAPPAAGDHEERRRTGIREWLLSKD